MDGPRDSRIYTSNGPEQQPEWVRERPITFEDLGITRTQVIRPSVFGNIRTCQSLRKLEWFLLAVGLLAIVATIGLAIYSLILHDTQDVRTAYVFALLLIYHSVFCTIYLLDGVFREQAFEVLALVVSCVILIVYVIFNFITSNYEVFKLVRLVATVVLGCCVGVIGGVLGYDYWQSKSLIFRTVGADAAIQDLCSTLFTTTTLIIFDAQIVGSVVILALHHGIRNLTPEEIMVITIGYPWLLAWAIIAYLALRMESKYFFSVALMLSPSHIVFVIFAIVHTALYHETGVLAQCRYAASAGSLVVHALLIFSMVRCFRNFGRGLKEKVYPRQTNVSDGQRQLVQ